MRVYKWDVKAAWRGSFQEEKSEYLGAIVKEALRFYTVSAMSLPRKTVSDVEWEGSRIPRGTMVLINAQAANHGLFPLIPPCILLDLKLTNPQMSTTSAQQPHNSTPTIGSHPSPQIPSKNQQQEFNTSPSVPDPVLAVVK